MSFIIWRITSITLFLFSAILILIQKALSYNFKITNTNQISGNITINNNATSSKELSAFVNFDNGDYAIFFENSSKNSYGISMVKYNFENTKILESQLSKSKPSFVNEKNPKALLLSEDTFIMLWQSQIQSAFSNASSVNEAIYALNAQIFDKNFNAVSKPFSLRNDKTLFSGGKTIVKISKFLFAVVFVEYLTELNSYSVNYSVFCVNGISVKNESLLTTKEKADVSVNYLNETTIFISFLADEKQ